MSKMLTFEELVRVVTLQQEAMEKMHEVMVNHNKILALHEQFIFNATDDGK